MIQTRNVLKTAAASVVIATAFALAPVQAAGQLHQVVNVYSNDTLNMRSAPNTDGNTLAEIPYNGRSLTSTGRTQGNWVEVTWNGQTGWVNGYYLSEQGNAGNAKVNAKAATNEASNWSTQPTQMSQNATQEPKNCWHGRNEKGQCNPDPNANRQPTAQTRPTQQAQWKQDYQQDYSGQVKPKYQPKAKAKPRS